MTEKCQSQELRAIIHNPSMTENIVGEFGWAKGPHDGAKPPPNWPHDGAKPPPNWPIRRGVRWLKALV